MECKDNFGFLLSKSFAETFSSAAFAPPTGTGTTFSLLYEKILMEEGRFERLNLAERADILWQQGQFVDSVMQSHYCLMLYGIHDQFVELLLDLHGHRIVSISIASEYDIEKYLTSIHLEV